MRTVLQDVRRCAVGPALVLLVGCAAVGPSAVTRARPDARETPAAVLERDVRALAGRIGMRGFDRPEAARAAAAHVEQALRSAGGRGRVHVQSYDAGGTAHRNVCLEVRGATAPEEIVVVGAHYDTAAGTPGADDNASGVAGLLALARRFASEASPPPHRTIRFVAFGTEEPPHTRTPEMGSYHFASACRARDEKVVAMISLEMIGYFSDEPGSQEAPPGLQASYPTVANFVVFAGHSGDAKEIEDARRTFAAAATNVPAETMILPARLVVNARVPLGANSSDQWSFWQHGYPGMMITDTANWRNANYHKPSDTPETLDYPRMARVVEGVEAVVRRWSERLP